MLSKHVIAGFIEKTDNALLMLKDYAPASQLYFLEARYALYELKLIFNSNPEEIEGSLVEFLSGRWEKVLKNTDAQYLHDFTNPANQACIEIARELGQIRKIPFLLLLMPTLSVVKEEDYITSSYADDDLRLQDLILSDGNDHLMHIPDILDGAQEDGVLKHNSLFSTFRGSHEVRALSATETNRLLSRSKEVKDAYEALQVRVNYKLYGNTLGAALNRLIQGLRDGGVNGGKYREREYDSGSDANASIVAFSLYLESLSDEARGTLMKASKYDRFVGPNPELRTVKGLWDRLARPKEAKYKETNFCVELIASPLAEILINNPGLYDICSFKDEELSGLSEVTTNYTVAMQVMKDTLPDSKLHHFYEKTREDEVCVNLIRIMSWAKGFYLSSEDILYFLKQYASIEKKSGGNFREVGKFLQHAVTICPGDIFVRAKAAMTEDELQLFHRLTKPSSALPDRSVIQFSLFPPLPGKRMAEDDSMCPPASRRRLSDNSLV